MGSRRIVVPLVVACLACGGLFDDTDLPDEDVEVEADGEAPVEDTDADGVATHTGIPQEGEAEPPETTRGKGKKGKRKGKGKKGKRKGKGKGKRKGKRRSSLPTYPPGVGSGIVSGGGSPSYGPPDDDHEPPAAAHRTTPRWLTKVSSRHFKVNKARVERWKEDYHRFGAGVDNTKKGFRLRGVGPRDAAWHLGLRNGDILDTMNGRKVHTVPQILLVYGKEKKKDHFVLTVFRGGSTITFTYDVVVKDPSRWQ